MNWKTLTRREAWKSLFSNQRRPRRLLAEPLEERRLLAAVVRSGVGGTPAEIQAVVDQFRTDLGDPLNGANPGSAATGRREINWDGVPDASAAPGTLAADFFNTTSPRGVIFETLGAGFAVSAKAGNPTATEVRFGDINAAYPAQFQTFSAERLFTPLGSNVTTVRFFVPGSNDLATVSGFGAVFADVDIAGETTIEFFDEDGNSLNAPFVVDTQNNGLSFLGVTFDAGERVSRVEITTGTLALGPAAIDGGTDDVVVMDDFFYAEPQSVIPPLLATNDDYETTEDAVLAIAAPGVLQNDTSATSVSTFDDTSLLGVTVGLNADGSLNYDPTGVALFQALKAGETLEDEFSYTASDGQGGASTATVRITITGVNDAPVAVDDDLSTTPVFVIDEEEIATAGAPAFLQNDADVDGDTLTIASVSATSANGAVVTMDGSGNVTYNPRDAAAIDALSEGQELLDTFTYTVSDGQGGTDVGTVTLKITGLNDAPTANDDAFDASPTETLNLTVVQLGANDVEIDQQDVLIISAVDAASSKGAVVTLNGDGTVTYDPTGVAEFAALGPGQTATDTFQYTISDGQGGTSSAVVTITVTGANQAPTPIDDDVATDADDVLSVAAPGLLANDTDPDAGDTLTVVAETITSTLGASVTLNADGSFSYDPTAVAALIALPAGQTTQDSFTYTVRDVVGAEATAIVSITVTGVNDAPQAGDDTGATSEDALLSAAPGALFANDSDPDTNDTFEAELTTPTTALGAKVGIMNNGSYFYDPRDSAQLQALKAGETVEDTFTYTIKDAAGLTATATVTITVTGVNDAPVAVDDADDTPEDVILVAPAGTLLANDTDADADDTLTVVAETITSSRGATVTLNADGGYTYNPLDAKTLRTLKEGETAVDTFSYTLRDAAGAEATATVSITVTGSATDTTAPAISVSGVTVVENAGSPTMLAFTVALEFPSLQTITVNFATADGSATADADYVPTNGTLTFAPGDSTKEILVEILDDSLIETPETVVINLTDAVNTSNATASGTGTITDDDNQPPVAVADTGATDENTVLTVNDPLLTANDTDPENHVPLVVVAETITSAQGAAVTINADGSYSYDPTAAAALQALGAGETLDDTFTYKVRDSFGAEAIGTVTITVTGLNDAPTAGGDAFDANEDEVLTIPAPGVVGNDSDADGDALQLTTTGTSSRGAIVTLNQDGSFTYNPTGVAELQALAAGETAQDFFIYTVSDGNGESVDALVAITVTGVNDDPVAVADTGAVNEDALLTVDAAGGLLANDTDAETGSVLAATAGTFTSQHGAAVMINADGSFTYDPRGSQTLRTLAIGSTVADTFTYTLSDGAGGTATGTATITVTGTTNDALPKLTIADVSLAEGNSGDTIFTFTVSLDFASLEAVTVDYATADAGGIDTGTAGSDYTAATGTLTFAAGSSTATFDVIVAGDTMLENDEVFLVNLTNAVNADIDDAQATGTITNDDAVPTISIADAAILEGNSGTTNLVFTVTLSNASENAVIVDFATTNGTATLAEDFEDQAGTLTFAPGETSKTISIVILGDTTEEADETFLVTLGNPTGATIADGEATGTITDDDGVPTLSIGDATVVEGNSGEVDLVFTITLSNAATTDVTLDYATAAGTAIAGTDFTAATGSLTIPAGQTSATITVKVNGDTLDEANETLTLTLSNVVGATLLDGEATGTIEDDDAAPTISIGDVTVVEGDSGTVNAVFTVTLSAASGLPVTVNFATADGTATAGSDYIAATGDVTFAPGETSKTITVQTIGDTTIEEDETFLVNLSNAVNATIADAQGEGTIEDADAPSLSIGDATIIEGNSGTVELVFTVTLSAAQSGPVTVNFATANGTAVAPGDYASQTGTLTFAAGELTKTITILVAGDTLDETDETFTVTLSNPSSGITLADGTGTGTITDDDAPPTMSISDATATEGDSGTVDMVFTVTISAASGQTITVPFNVVAGTATIGSDIEAQSGTLTFEPGQTSRTITVKVIGDTIDEAVENFTVSLGGPTNASLVDGVGTGTIEDNDPTPQGPTLSIGDVQIVEGNDGTKQMVFTVTLSVSSTQTVTVAFATTDGSATAGSDYTTTNGTLTFNPGETQKQISVPIAGDTTVEPHETLIVTLNNATGGATISDSSAIGTITNDDGTVNISISDATVNEGNSGTTTATFTVTLSAASSQSVTVDFATAAGTALAGTDFVANNGTITFAPGEVTKTITVTVNGDTLDEANETFSVNLTNPTNGTLLDDTGAGTITDDDPAPTISIADQSITEGNTGTKTLTFTVTLSAVSGLPVTVNYATAGGTATSGADFVAGNGTVTIAAGQTSATFTVTINGDTTVESNENFTVTLSNPTNATIADGTATGTITDDDAAVTVSIGDATVTEGNSGNATMTFTITLSGPSGQTVTVNYATSDGTATQPGDYAQANGTVTFAPGETSKTITVNVVGDSLDEANETFTVTLSNPTNATLNDATATGTITDDDTAGTIQFANAVFTVNEGAGTVTITVTRSGGSAANATVNYTTSNGSATAGSDYTTASGTITFLAGETSKTFTVSILNDAALESLESFNLALSSPGGGATLGAQSTATVNITDNDGNTNQRYINSLYEDLLGRQAEQQGIDFYVDLMQRGQSRGDIAFMIQHSPEYRNKLVSDLYQEILGRAADAAGLDAHARLLARGKSIDDVRAALLSSDEFFTRRGGGTNDGYVNALYQTVLGRAVDATGRSIYGNVLSSGGSRYFVASEVLKSIEADRRQSSQYYTKYLSRTADSAGNEFQANAMQTGYEPRVLAGILASDEYFSKL